MTQSPSAGAYAAGSTGGRPAASDASCPAEPAASGLAALFRQYHAELVRLAVLLVRDQQTAEDVVQDVFLHIRRDRLPRPESSLAYLRAAVLNGCRSVLRRRAIARRLGRGHGAPAEMAWHESAEHAAIRAEERREVLAALAALPARRREVLVLRYYLGLSEAEIASTLGISRGAVKSSAARGITALARALKEES
jgi:RNA polymerase sigma-70 factor (sigma-E family)